MMITGKTNIDIMKKPLTLMVVALSLIIVSCGTPTYDGPPWPDTPDPDPLSGVYSGDYGTLTFSGDGNTVTADFSGTAEEIIADGEYGYVFLWNSGGEVRYDIATDFRLYRGEDYWLFSTYGGLPEKFTIRYYYSNASKYENTDLDMIFELTADNTQTEHNEQEGK